MNCSPRIPALTTLYGVSAPFNYDVQDNRQNEKKFLELTESSKLESDVGDSDSAALKSAGPASESPVPLIKPTDI